MSALLPGRHLCLAPHGKAVISAEIACCFYTHDMLCAAQQAKSPVLFDAADFPPLGAASPPRRRGRNDKQRFAACPPQEQRPLADTTEVRVRPKNVIKLTSTRLGCLREYASTSTAHTPLASTTLTCSMSRPQSSVVATCMLLARLRQRTQSSSRRKRLRCCAGLPRAPSCRRCICQRAAATP